MRKALKSIVILSLTLLAATPAAGQDLLANQAPASYKMKSIDSIARRRLLKSDMAENPAAALYGNWGEKYARQASSIPDSFRIVLKDFCMPTESRVVTSAFGIRRGRQHKGVDIKVYTGDTIRATFSGKVRIVRNEVKGKGNYVVVRHQNGLETIYSHMSKNLVRQDQDVKAGTPIGLGGNSGQSATSHLHFETRLCGIALDPALLFDFKNQDVTGDYYVFHRNSDSQTQPSSNAKQDNTARATRYHKVTRGETLSSIAHKHRTTVDALCRLNHIGKSRRLMPGQILKYN